MIISSPTGAPLLDAESFVAAAVEHFGEHARVVTTSAAPHTDVSVDVTRPGEPGFLVDHDVDGTAVRVDGTPEQDAEVAAWVRSLLPDDGTRVIGFDGDWGWHVELVAGITPERVLAERVDHGVPGWDEDDPDLR